MPRRQPLWTAAARRDWCASSSSCIAPDGQRGPLTRTPQPTRLATRPVDARRTPRHGSVVTRFLRHRAVISGAGQLAAASLPETPSSREGRSRRAGAEVRPCRAATKKMTHSGGYEQHAPGFFVEHDGRQVLFVSYQALRRMANWCHERRGCPGPRITRAKLDIARGRARIVPSLRGVGPRWSDF
jgi:hypothetical protein